MGGSSRLSRLGGMARSEPVLAVLFLVPALSLVGIPPLSGFIAKFALVDAAAARSSYVILAVSLVVSLLTLYSLMKVWIAVFWSPARDPVPDATCPGRASRSGWPAAHDPPTAALAALTLAIGLAGPLYDYSLRPAADLLDPSAYVTEVLG